MSDGALSRDGRSASGHGGTLEDMRASARPIHSRGPAWLNIGWLVVAAALALTLFGVAAIDTTQPGSAVRQFVHLMVGLVFAIVVAVPDYRRLRRFTWPLAILSVLLLVFVLVPWVPEAIVRPRKGALPRRGSTRGI